MIFKIIQPLRKCTRFNKIIIIFLISLSHWNCNTPKQSGVILTVEIVPPEAGIVLGFDSKPYDNGAVVTLTAIPEDGHYFNSWSGDAQGNLNPKSIVMNESKTIQANFSEHVYPVSMLDNYSDVNKKTSWYVTNKNYHYFNIGLTTYANFALDDGDIRPVWNYQCCDSTWSYDIAGYIYTDLDNDGRLDLWQNYLKNPWPSNISGIHLFSSEVDNIISTPQGTFDPNDYIAVYGLKQIRKQVLSDIDNDGINEIILFSHGHDAYPFPGDSIGIFYPSSKEYGFLSEDLGFFHGGAAADINNSGFIDIIAVAGWSAVYPPHPTLYINGGGGSFSLSNDAFINFEGKNFYEVELFDINNDSYVDLFFSGGGELYAVLGNESGVYDFNANIDFQEFISGNLQPMDINFFDFNKDGKKDILLLNNLNSYNGHSITILLQNEDQGTFDDSTAKYMDEYSTLADDFWVKWLYLSDIDRDGDIDLVADGLFGESGNHNLDVLYWENISGFFHRRQEAATVHF